MMSQYFLEREQCSRHQIFPGVVVSTWWEGDLMLSLAELEPHAVVEFHHHPHVQIGMLLEGKAIFIIGGEERQLQAGDRFRIPSNVPHKVIALDQPVKALDAFTPVREEYK